MVRKRQDKRKKEFNTVQHNVRLGVVMDEVQENKEHNILYADMPDVWNRL